jgi:hypothetical protein
MKVNKLNIEPYKKRFKIEINAIMEAKELESLLDELMEKV